MSKAMRQMLEQSGRAGAARGEAASYLTSDEACGPLLDHQGTGSAKLRAGTGGLLEAALTRQNLQAAWKRVKANKGAAGVGRMSMHQVIKGVNPFLITYLIILTTFILFPQIVTAPVAWMR